MSWQARCFIAVMGGRHLAIAAMILWSGLEFPEGSYRFIKEIQPLSTWAAIMAIVGVAAIIAAAAGVERWARWVVIPSVAVTATWALGFIAAAIDGSLLAPTSPVMWSVLVLKDLMIASSDLSRLDLSGLTVAD